MDTLYVRLDFPVAMVPLRPSNSTICPGNGPKSPPEAPNFVYSKRDSEGTYSTRNPPLFVVSTPQNYLNGHLDPRT